MKKILFSFVTVFVLLAGVSLETLKSQNELSITSATKMPEEIEPIVAPFAMRQLQKPVFPKRSFNIVDYGAKAGGEIKNTKAIGKAIEACTKAGGGTVLVPAGRWLSGPIHLRSNVNLHFEPGAELHFSHDPNDYLPIVFTRYAGLELYNISPFIYANNCENIAITGPGKLFGYGEKWWHRKQPKEFVEIHSDTKRLPPVEERIFSGLRPQFINPINCKNVLLEGFSISTPGPFWTIHIAYCENVIVRGLNLDVFGGPNNDGINLDSSKDVLVEYCNLNTGDDNVAIKSGLKEDGWRVGLPSKNIVVRHIAAFQGHGFCIGSEMSGGVKNVYFHDISIEKTMLGIRIKTNPSRGGYIENIFYDNIRMEDVESAISIESNYWSEEGDSLTKISNLYFTNITCNSSSASSILVDGNIKRPIENISFDNIDINGRRDILFKNVNNLLLNDVKYKHISNPIIPPNCLFTHENKPGVEASFFNNKYLSGEPVAKRIDRIINHTFWGFSSPVPEVNHDNFSIRWNGILKVEEAGIYSIGLEGDDGYRLYLNGRLIIDAWSNYTNGEFRSVEIFLKEGEYNDFIVEYFEEFGFGYVKMKLKKM